MILYTTWIPAAIAGAAAIAGMIGNNISRKKAAKRARQQALEDEARKNEYNSPKAQMQRFKDANLNPNLMYSQGSSGNTEGPQQTEQFQADVPLGEIAGNSINAYYNLERHKAGMDMNESKQRQIDAETRKIDQQNHIQSQKWLTDQIHYARNAGNDAEAKRLANQHRENEINFQEWNLGYQKEKAGREEQKHQWSAQANAFMKETRQEMRRVWATLPEKEAAQLEEIRSKIAMNNNTAAMKSFEAKLMKIASMSLDAAKKEIQNMRTKGFKEWYKSGTEYKTLKKGYDYMRNKPSGTFFNH